MSRPDEWISGVVADEVYEQARTIRQQRDRDPLVAGLDQIRDRSLRESGEIGELCFDRWLTRQGCRHTWITNDVVDKPDFVITGQTIDVKTRNRIYAKSHYTFGVQGFCLYKPTDWFCFVGYEEAKNIVTIYGLVPRFQMLHRGRIVRPGENVHTVHRLRTVDITFEFPIADLIGPKEWLIRTHEFVAGEMTCSQVSTHKIPAGEVSTG